MLQLHEEQPPRKGTSANTSARFARFTPQELQYAQDWLKRNIALGAERAKHDDVHHGTASLTPVLGTILLEERNPDNRPFKEAFIDKFASDARNKSWKLNGETIIISRCGLLNDGQNRCAAVIKAGVAIRTVFIFGPERETRLSVDQGGAKTAGDYIGMNRDAKGNHVPNSIVMATVATSLWQMGVYGQLSHQSKYRPPKGETLRVSQEHPDIQRSIQAIPTKKSGLLGGRTLLVLCHYMFAHSSTWDDADDFASKLMDGFNLPPNSPVAYTRNRLMNTKKLDVNARAELMFRTWNCWRRGETPKTLPILGGKLPKLER